MSFSLHHQRTLKNGDLSSKSRVGPDISAFLTSIEYSGYGLQQSNEGLISSNSLPITLRYISVVTSLPALIHGYKCRWPNIGTYWTKPCSCLHLLQRAHVASFRAQSHGQLETLTG